jgi:hypothetical protein
MFQRVSGKMALDAIAREMCMRNRMGVRIPPCPPISPSLCFNSAKRDRRQMGQRVWRRWRETCALSFRVIPDDLDKLPGLARAVRSIIRAPYSVRHANTYFLEPPRLLSGYAPSYQAIQALVESHERKNKPNRLFATNHGSPKATIRLTLIFQQLFWRPAGEMWFDDECKQNCCR